MRSRRATTPRRSSQICRRCSRCSAFGNARRPHCLAGLKVAWVGDSNNILNDMLVAIAFRLGINLSVATPKGAAYQRDELVWGTMQDGLSALSKSGSSPVALGQVNWTNDQPRRYVMRTSSSPTRGSAWATRRRRYSACATSNGFQVTEPWPRRAAPSPTGSSCTACARKGDEVDDEVFYSDRSIVFPEAENRKWTIMSLFDRMYGRWEL